jgi:uncharacterized Tic20 family protein
MDFEAYGLVLAIHSTLRWVVLVGGLVAAAAAWAARFGARSWTDTTTAAGRAFAVAMDLQFVVGLVLYVVLSPTVAAGLRNMSGAMGDAHHRFWMLEHPAAMILALVLAHIGVAQNSCLPARRRRAAVAVPRLRPAVAAELVRRSPTGY